MQIENHEGNLASDSVTAESHAKAVGIETWKAEFYPVGADECPHDQALSHSLQKWRGLRHDALMAHGLTTTSGGDLKSGGVVFRVDASTCALCEAHPRCDGCPLFESRGEVSCDFQTEREEEANKPSPFEAWQTDQDPEPMIAALLAAAPSNGGE